LCAGIFSFWFTCLYNIPFARRHSLPFGVIQKTINTQQGTVTMVNKIIASITYPPFFYLLKIILTLKMTQKI
jgi:hypothetical protein